MKYYYKGYCFISVLDNLGEILSIVTTVPPSIGPELTNENETAINSTNRVLCHDTDDNSYSCHGSLQGLWTNIN